jgi:hypothetical protein
MSKVAIPESVRAYEGECRAILSWLKNDEWIDQHEFDRKSFEWALSGGSGQLTYYTPETLLPPLFGGDVNLMILHEFQRENLVQARKRNGKIEYRLLSA